MKLRIAVAGILAVLWGSGASAQSLNLTDRAAVQVSPGDGPAFGTSSTAIALIPATSFLLASGTEGPLDGSTVMRTCATPCIFIAGLSLPSGAALTDLEFEACDGDTAQSVAFALLQFSSPVQAGTIVSPVGNTGGPQTPGCALFSVPLSRTVDNLVEKLILDINVGSGTNLGFTAARVRYNLQISPAPGAATFNDVPTGHPQFQFIEALVAAGITAGCGGGNYCPDASLTRGQMAVFLSKALGLHFPN